MLVSTGSLVLGQDGVGIETQGRPVLQKFYCSLIQQGLELCLQLGVFGCNG